MQNTENNIQPIPKKSLTGIARVFICVGLALTTSYLLAWLANHIGILFTGTHTFFAILMGTIVSCVAAAVIEFIFKRKAKQFTWRSLVISVTLTSFIVVGFLSWSQTRDALKLFVNPVPSNLHVNHGYSDLFATYVHFTAPPEIIIAVIQSHQLASPTNADDSLEQIEKDKVTKTSCNWWQPATMSNPKFFMRHHESQAVQGWTEGWWINDATNEVYAFIGG